MEKNKKLIIIRDEMLTFELGKRQGKVLLRQKIIQEVMKIYLKDLEKAYPEDIATLHLRFPRLWDKIPKSRYDKFGVTLRRKLDVLQEMLDELYGKELEIQAEINVINVKTRLSEGTKT